MPLARFGKATRFRPIAFARRERENFGFDAECPESRRRRAREAAESFPGKIDRPPTRDHYINNTQRVSAGSGMRTGSS
jgi:hypothetical protein